MLADISPQFTSTSLLLELLQTVLWVWKLLPSFSSSKYLQRLHHLLTHLVKYIVILSFNASILRIQNIRIKQIINMKKTYTKRLCLKYNQTSTSSHGLNSILKGTQIPTFENNVGEMSFRYYISSTSLPNIVGLK